MEVQLIPRIGLVFTFAEQGRIFINRIHVQSESVIWVGASSGGAERSGDFTGGHQVFRVSENLLRVKILPVVFINPDMCAHGASGTLIPPGLNRNRSTDCVIVREVIVAN